MKLEIRRVKPALNEGKPAGLGFFRLENSALYEWRVFERVNVGRNSKIQFFW